jgi:hypothetical protein
MARLYVAELGSRQSPATQTASFNTIADARQWAQGHGSAADWCVIRCSGREVARHERDTGGDGLRWFRVLPERNATARRPQRKFFIFGPRNDNNAALRLMGVVLVRGENAADLRRRLIEREGYPDNITVKRLDRKRKGQVLESAGPPGKSA